MRAIRRYLNLTLAAALLTVTLLAVTAAYFVTHHEMEEIFDAQLSLQARIVSALVAPGAETSRYAEVAQALSQPRHFAAWYEQDREREAEAPDAELYMHEERVISLGFWKADGEPLLMGPRWNDGQRTFPAPARTGYRWVDHDGHRWRVFSRQIDSGRWVSIGVRESFQDELSNKVALGNFIPLLLTLPILLWLMARLVRRGLAPIDQLSRQVETRDDKDLSAIDVAVPRELLALRAALNDFIARLGLTLERERRFTADAAHELRTPLAAVKIHLDNARYAEAGALDHAYAGIERLQRVVDQLLLLARLEIGEGVAPFETVELSHLVFDLAAELWPLAEFRGQSLEIAESDPVQVQGHAVELGMLIRNLLDNALRYTPEGGSVGVAMGSTADGVWLTIRDTGPGIPEHLLGAVTQRFQRAADQRITGSGLGLAIAVEIAERQRLALTLANHENGGLVVRLEWRPTVV